METLQHKGVFARIRPGPGAVVLWVHGYTLNGSIWEPLWDRLPGYGHVGMDLPGHGHSRPILPGEDLGSVARAVLEMADAVDARHLVGLSFGGMVALQTAIDNPNRFASVCLASPGLAGGPQDPEAATCNLELMHLAKQRGLGPWLSERWMSIPPRIFAGAAKHPELLAQLREVVARHSFRELLDESMAGFQQAQQDPRAIALIRSRTTVLVGEEDMEAFKRCAQLIRRALPSARRIYMADSGHLSILEDPAKGAEIIEQTLSES